MILMEKRTAAPHGFAKEKLTGRVWHKYVLHKLRHGNLIERRIREAKAWAEENMQEDWMVHIMDYNNCALFYVEDDSDAMLFELGHIFHADDKRGKKDWSA